MSGIERMIKLIDNESIKMSAIWKHSKKVINVNFCVPNCGHFQTNWLNFCPQLGRYVIIRIRIICSITFIIVKYTVIIITKSYSNSIR